jgi:lysophospholipase L1-like esterase
MAPGNFRRTARRWAYGGRSLFERAWQLGRRLVHPQLGDPPTEAAWFARMPHLDAPLVFLGDSLTAFGRWSELFPDTSNILNRGIPGNTSDDVIGRLDEVTRRGPRGVLLMVGTNDLLRQASAAHVLTNVETIVDELQSRVAGVQIVLQGVLPVREDELYEAVAFNARALELNRGLAELARRRGCPWCDFHALFADPQGQLRAQYTYDGVHLTPEAYLVWANEVRGALEAVLARELTGLRRS